MYNGDLTYVLKVVIRFQLIVKGLDRSHSGSKGCLRAFLGLKYVEVYQSFRGFARFPSGRCHRVLLGLFVVSKILLYTVLITGFPCCLLPRTKKQEHPGPMEPSMSE